MGAPQTPGLVRLPQEFLLTLPSCEEKVALRKMTTRDQTITNAKFDANKRQTEHGNELVRVCTIKPGTISRDLPYGEPFFTPDEFLDVEVEDLSFLAEASMKLNKMGKYEKEYKFDF